MIMTEKSKLVVRLDKELKNQLKKRAVDEEKTVTEIVRKLIKDYLNT